MPRSIPASMLRATATLLLAIAACRPEPSPTPPPEPTPAPEPTPEPTPTPGGAAQGETCDGGAACAEGLTCVEYFGIAGPNGPKFTSCEIPCPDAKTTCPEGQSCVTIADGPGQVCRPPAS